MMVSNSSVSVSAMDFLIRVEFDILPDYMRALVLHLSYFIVGFVIQSSDKIATVVTIG